MHFRELRPAFAMIFSLGLTGCIFLVDSLPDGTSTTCNLTTPPFSDGTNACKTCITDSCQNLLDVCCGDSTCQAQLNNVDSCANGDGCNALASAGGTEGATSDLIACIAGNCGKDCYGIDAGPASDGSTSSCSGGVCAPACTFSSDQSQCACSVSSTQGNDNTTGVCPSSTASASVCCASNDYPNVAGGSCTCQSLYCEDDGNGVCDCQLGVTGSSSTSSCYPSGGGSCCLSADRSSCTCDPTDECDRSGETQVESCSVSVWQCPTSTTLVDYCVE